MRAITVVICLCAHQPLGEDDAVIARAVQLAYRPLIDALWDNEHIAVAMRISGALPEWLDANDLPLLERLAALVARGQVEMLTGAHFGAVLHTIPERDALAQLQLHTLWLHRRLGARARCAWLDEGAWDGSLPKLLSRAGVAVALLDEAQVRGAGIAGRVEGWYVTEREGSAVGVLPIDRRLSGFMPWAAPKTVLADVAARARAGATVLVAALPMENLGLYPRTQDWCWSPNNGWVKRFFGLLARQDYWLRLSLPSQLLNTRRPSGRAAPAAGTPSERGLAALDISEARAFEGLQRAIAEGDPKVLAAEPWLEGPPWESFLVRYDEANLLHKHMLRTSSGVLEARRGLLEGLRGGQTADRALSALEPAVMDLLRAQSAAPLHSAPGGGLYRPEIRHHAWAALLRADKVVRGLRGQTGALTLNVADHDCDGQREVLIETPTLSALVRPGAGGALAVLGLWEVGNFINTLSRREELWHEELNANARLPLLIDESPDEDERTDPKVSVVEDDEDVTDSFTLSELPEPPTGPVGDARQALPRRPPLPILAPGLDELLGVDRHRRGSFLVHFLGGRTTLANLSRGQHPQLGDFLDAGWQLVAAEEHEGEEVSVKMAREGVIAGTERQRLVRIAKDLRFFRDRSDIELRLEVTNRSPEPFETRMGLEFNFGLDGTCGPGRYLEVPGEGVFPLDQRLELSPVTEAHFVFADVRRRIRIQASPGGHLYMWPVETPMRAGTGYGLAFQGSALMFAWDLSLWGAEKSTFDLTLSVEHE